MINIVNQWNINKIGLINFWLYDEEEFLFEDGKLLLRGTNGSGKSVTTQSFIPLLLDGNKRPERIDPFGKKARKMEDYLLGDGKKSDSTAYLYMELIKKDTKNIVTIGMGLHARLQKQMDFWGFCINDGRRIGEDIFLYKKMDLKVPLTKSELKNIIGQGGEIHEKQEDYMNMVNRYIFGFEQISDYEHLINLLIQVRSPKLSTDFKPSVIYEILNSSLQTLSDDDLLPMASAIEHMDNIQIRLEGFKSAYSAMGKLKNVYNRYNSFILFKKAKQYKEAFDLYEKEIKKRQSIHGEILENEKVLEFCKVRIEEIERQKIDLEKQIEDISENDISKVERELSEREELLKDRSNALNTKNIQLDKKKKERRVFEKEQRDNEDKLYFFKDKIHKELMSLSDLNKNLSFYEHEAFVDEVKASDDTVRNFDRTQQEFENYQLKIEDGLNKFREHKRIDTEYNKKVENQFQVQVIKKKAKNIYDQAVSLEYEIRDEWKEKLYNWNNLNKELILDKDNLISLSNAIKGYKDQSYRGDVIKPVEKKLNDARYILDDLISSEILDITKEEDIKKSLEKELKIWLDKKDPEPIREDKCHKFREKLLKMKVPFISFYKAVDFKESLKDDIKINIEEAILDMGLLDAIIIPSKYKSKVLNLKEKGIGDSFIFDDGNKAIKNLSDYLKVDESIGQECKLAAFNVLNQIGIGNGISNLSVDGRYKIGILEGFVSSEKEPIFIGALSREKYRSSNINRLKEEIDKSLEKIKILNTNKEGLLRRKETLYKEFNNFPAFDDLDSAIQQVRIYEDKLKIATEEEEKIDREVENLKDALDKAWMSVNSIIRDMPISANLKSYEEAFLDSRKYMRCLNELKTLALKCDEISSVLKIVKDRIESSDEDIDDIYYDINKLEREISIIKLRIESILALLDSPEAKRSAENLKNLKERLNKGEEEKTEKVRESSRLSERNKNLSLQLLNIEDIISNMDEDKNITEDILKEELNLNYVDGDYLGVTTIQTSANVLNLLHEDNKTLVEYNGLLDSEFKKHMSSFAEYKGIIENIFKPYDKYFSQRSDITFSYGHKKMPFISMYSILQDIIDEQENLLKEEDRKLFEDILANTLSRKLSARITSSKAWVKKMNILMEGLSTSMGLSFSLTWRENQALEEDELNTKQLVSLLQADANLLSQKDMESLTLHFRSKIKNERKLSLESGIPKSYFEMMRDALDFRNWFEFVLYYKVTNEDKKEMTDRAFFRFSGGERAMAMYVPLFTAVYARYDGANKDCLRIISLDEAFAGVDDINIGSMFKLLEDLKLNYMINSQVLWGCYESVPALSICDLKRPNNSDIVTIIRYRWNGRARELMV